MKILVTGAAGFIGSALCIQLLKKGHNVVGIDNHNDYYDPALKEKRLQRHIKHPEYTHIRMDIEDQEAVNSLFSKYSFNRVVNLAAQAGVRYSIENPLAYVKTNIVGFTHILEGCRHSNVEHLVYASSSSVYGSNTKMPFSIHDNVDHPLSLYAASKKTNELLAHTYSHLYNLPTTGLRFFTVYGPWGRPDMALFRIIRVLNKPPKGSDTWEGNNPDPGSSIAPWRVYNIGNNKPIDLLDYIQAIEKALKIKAKKEFLPLQPGDVPDTYADVDDLIKEFDFKPKKLMNQGVKNFIKWYLQYHD